MCVVLTLPVMHPLDCVCGINLTRDATFGLCVVLTLPVILPLDCVCGINLTSDATCVLCGNYLSCDATC